jgi:hypothetical protein
MTSLDEAFRSSEYPTWEDEYYAKNRAEGAKKKIEMANLLQKEHGISFDDLRPRQEGGRRTNDGSTHYVHSKTGDLYKYVYAFGPPRWVKKPLAPIVKDQPRSKWCNCCIC